MSPQHRDTFWTVLDAVRSAVDKFGRDPTEFGEHNPHEQSYELNPETVQGHAKWLHQHLLNPLAFVHCEATLIAYILRHPGNSFYNYIGVSKLCRRGCYALVEAINIILGKKFIVRGCHHEFYYPWKFPQIPHHHAVAQSMLASLCYKLGQTYQGFRPATQQYLSDSEAASTPNTSSDREDDGFRVIKEVTKGKTQFEFISTYCSVVSY